VYTYVLEYLGTRVQEHPGVSAKTGEAVKRKKYKGAVLGFVVEAGGWVPRPRSSSTRWCAECEMSEAARKAAASKIMRAIGIEVMHKQAYMMATLVQELRNEEQFYGGFCEWRSVRAGESG
jgi:hypothetical protein